MTFTTELPHHNSLGPGSFDGPPSGPDAAAGEFYAHSTAPRISTDTVIAEALRQQYPTLQLTIAPVLYCDLLAYASAGHAKITPLPDEKSPLGASYEWSYWMPPARRTSGGRGAVTRRIQFGKFLYRWRKEEGLDEEEFVLYVANGRDGSGSYPQVVCHYILAGKDKKQLVDDLLVSNGLWLMSLRNEVWVFDQGFWRKDAELWRGVENASWDDVILDEGKKKSIINDAEGFFNSQETYKALKVPWRRGIIYYGPPGNGKTISVKAMMHTLFERDDPIPTLYVKTLASVFAGPEYSIRMIFSKARQEAPCYLVFEDLDSIVSDRVRSYFLNEVDGLNTNDGILMVGSTNHLELLDPGIAKRPSRFDRKYEFPNPSYEERITYCHFWQKKLSSNNDVEFPDELCPAIAGITGSFSFAYIQEAFVASLLAIARRSGSGSVRPDGKSDGELEWVEAKKEHDGNDEDPLDKYELWVEIKEQIKTLREGLEDADPNRKTL